MKVKVLIPFVGPGHSYMIGDYVDAPEGVAVSWVKHSMVEAVKATDIPKGAVIAEHKIPVIETPISGDIPGYAELKALGVETVEQLKELGNLAKVKSIGKELAAEIATYLKK